MARALPLTLTLHTAMPTRSDLLQNSGEVWPQIFTRAILRAGATHHGATQVDGTVTRPGAVSGCSGGVLLLNLHRAGAALALAVHLRAV